MEKIEALEMKVQDAATGIGGIPSPKICAAWDRQIALDASNGNCPPFFVSQLPLVEERAKEANAELDRQVSMAMLSAEVDG